MIKAQQGVLERRSLEDNCLSKDGEEMSSACKFFQSFSIIKWLLSCYYLDCAVPVFTRPAPTIRSRSSTCTSSSGGDTPPLRRRMDLQILEDHNQATFKYRPLTDWFRTFQCSSTYDHCWKKQGSCSRWSHRTPTEVLQISHFTLLCTIEEDMSNASTPAKSLVSKKSNPITRQPVFVVNSDTISVHSKLEEFTRDDKHGITTFRKYYALRDEAENVVVERSVPGWNTPSSLFALQSMCITFLFPLSFTNSFHQLSKHQEVQPCIHPSLNPFSNSQVNL